MTDKPKRSVQELTEGLRAASCGGAALLYGKAIINPDILDQAAAELKRLDSITDQAHELLHFWVLEDSGDCGNAVDWQKIRQAKELLREAVEEE